ncbi:MAG TPA: hypothetical protein VGG74_29225 [Kofleriaceae bacterium]
MRSWIRVAAFGAVAVVGCKFNAGSGQTDANAPIDGPIDAPIDAVVNPDGGTCTAASVQCLPDGVTLRTCAAQNDNPVDTVCAWGCITANTPHCGQLVPTGSAATGSDVIDGSGALGSATLPDGTVIDSMAGGIKHGSTMIRMPGIGIDATSKIDFEMRNGVGVFRFAGLTIAGGVSFMEPGAQKLYPAVVLVSTQDLTVNGAIDAQGDCSGGDGGPGGQLGATGHSDASGSGGGSGGASNDKAQGGGGGGFGAAGGSGGDDDQPATTPPAGGVSFGDTTIAVLIGGGGGGGGGNDGNAFGGGGGGAIQLVANGTLTIGSNGSINAGGCGGVSGASTGGGGGGGAGGAGGAILLEAHDVIVDGQLAVNGGGGGAANVKSDSGADATLGRGAAPGSPNGSAAGGANGGNGGYALSLTGMPGFAANGWGGGGGGGVGRMRFNTYAGSASVPDEDQLSPNLNDNQSTCTQGVAQTQ